MSQLEVDKIIPQSGTTLTIGDSGDTVNFADGTSIGIDTNTLYIDSTNNRVGIGTSSPSTKLTIDEGGEPPAEGMLILQANSSSRQLRIQPPTNADNGFIDYRGGNLTFLDNGTEVARFQGSTGFEVTGTIKVSDGIYLGGTGTANKLDDYETGYFEPNIQPTTGSITWDSTKDKLSYTKIGRFVHITGQLVVSSVSSPSGFTRGSLPFTLLNQDEQSERTVGVANVTGTTLNAYEFGLFPNGGTDTFLEIVRLTGSINRDAGSYFQSGTSIYISYSYVSV